MLSFSGAIRGRLPITTGLNVIVGYPGKSTVLELVSALYAVNSCDARGLQALLSERGDLLKALARLAPASVSMGSIYARIRVDGSVGVVESSACTLRVSSSGISASGVPVVDAPGVSMASTRFIGALLEGLESSVVRFELGGREYILYSTDSGVKVRVDDRDVPLEVLSSNERRVLQDLLALQRPLAIIDDFGHGLRDEYLVELARSVALASKRKTVIVATNSVRALTALASAFLPAGTTVDSWRALEDALGSCDNGATSITVHLVSIYKNELRVYTANACTAIFHILGSRDPTSVSILF